MEFPYYPLNDFGPVMKGLVIGGMGILHVFLAQFAIGGGLLLTFFEWRARRGADAAAEAFVASYFRTLVLVSFVLGALTGVGMWLTAIQVSPRTIGLMVRHFHWLWAVEWTFFVLEIFAGYTYYRYRERLTAGQRLRLAGLYAGGGWFSLFWINGILSWQLTPGAWLERGSLWAGFFNPSFWPSLVFRTIAAMAIAALVAAVVINTMTQVEERDRRYLLRLAARFLLPMTAMPALAAWFLLVLPADSRGWLLGGSPAMTLFAGVSAGASLMVGMYGVVAIVLRRHYVNGATATLLVALAFAATGAGEFVREGARKPYTIRNVLYSNAIEPGEMAYLRRRGSVTDDPYPLKDGDRYPTAQLALGKKVFRFQCSICHTVDGANGVVHLAGTWTIEQQRMNLAKLQHTKPFMPPFAGSAEELEALVQLIRWWKAGEPESWPTTGDAALYRRLERWIDEAGIEPRAGVAPGREAM